MTDRLSTLLRGEADEIAVPAAPAPAVLRRGRSLRRRHRLAQGAAAAAVVAVVATAGVAGTRLLGPGGGSGDGVAGAPDSDGAFALGSTVYAGATRVDVGEPVKVLYYTSAGVLVRSGDEPWTDAPGTSRYSLLHGDGTLKRLDLVLGDVMPSTDGTSPHVAYAHRRGKGWEVVVRDVGTDRVVGRAPVDATLDKRGWSTPPVELSGDKVYVATGTGILEVDWRTGRQRQVPGTPADTLPDVAGDTWLDHTGRQIVVRRLADGKPVLSIPSKRLDYGMLSPDGSHVLVVDQSDEDSESRFTVYRVASGSSRTFRSPWYEQGWTPAGDLLRVHGSTVSTCDADTGRCSKQTIDLPPGGSQELKLAGKSYES